MKKADIAVIVVFLAAAAVLFGLMRLNGKKGAYAEVYVNGRYSHTLPLDKDAVYIPPEKPNVKIVVKDGKAAFTESDCPDKVCIHTGFIGTAGQTAVCLPNAVSLIIRSAGENAPDTVA